MTSIILLSVGTARDATALLEIITRPYGSGS